MIMRRKYSEEGLKWTRGINGRGYERVHKGHDYEEKK